MEKLDIKATLDTPRILIDPENQPFLIEGKSVPEDIQEFFSPVINWFIEYSKEPADSTVIEFRMKYYNTSSSKMFLDLLLILEEVVEAGKEVLVKWFYHEEDDDMLEAGEDYEATVNVPFEMIEF